MSGPSRRFWGWALGAVLLMSGGTAATVFFTTPDPSGDGWFERIREGMTADEVHAILDPVLGPPQAPEHPEFAVWTDGENEFIVWFNDGFAMGKQSHRLSRAEQGKEP